VAEQPVVVDESKSAEYGPDCERCGAVTLLVHREAHPRLIKQEVRTYLCPVCQHREVVSAPVE
jgi:hypothetical protein